MMPTQRLQCGKKIQCLFIFLIAFLAHAHAQTPTEQGLDSGNDMLVSATVDATSSAAMDAAAGQAVPYVNDVANGELFRSVA